MPSPLLPQETVAPAIDRAERPEPLPLGPVRSPMTKAGTEPSWNADYSWSAHRGGPGLTVRLFRLRLDAATLESSPLIHVTADARYKLWLNGALLGFGPAKGTLGRYYFESYKLEGLLQRGQNVLCAEVRWFGENSPGSEFHSPIPGFLMQGEGTPAVDTPGNWKVWTCDAVTPDTTPYIDNAQQFLNHTERIDLTEFPSGWLGPDFNDSSWEPAVSTGPARALGETWGVAPMRSLYARELPPMAESRHRFTRTIQHRSEIDHPFASPPSGFTVAAGDCALLLLDAGDYTTAFPELRFHGGRGREVKILYAEALGEWRLIRGRSVWLKSGRRDDFTRLEPHGYVDTLILRGGNQDWEPFYWRAFRWIQIEILPGDTPVTVTDATFRECVHPQNFSASFSGSDPEAKQIFQISAHTLKVGAHEIYDDSPYFEQFSYIADSRLEALGSLHLCNDPSLPRRTLQLFLDTLRPDGLLDSRAPCQYARQTIPYFCLHWIFMLEDYWTWLGAAESDFVRKCLLAVNGIAGFFEAHLRPDGFVGRTGGWNMVDMAAEWPHGVPPAVEAGGSTYLTCLLIEGLRSASRLHNACGSADDSRRWGALAARLQAAVRTRAWDAENGLFVEGLDHRKDRFSQHTQAAAILADTADELMTERILTRLCRDPGLIRANSMQSFYLSRAVEKAGRYGEWHAHVLAAWRDGLGKGLTTWPEYPDPCRSDSHAWASWPAVDYVASVLGIRPGAPGWTRARLGPQVAGLEWAEGTAPTPHGPIHVRWEKRDRVLRFRAIVPSGLGTGVYLPGGVAEFFPNGGHIELRAPLEPA